MTIATREKLRAVYAELRKMQREAFESLKRPALTGATKSCCSRCGYAEGDHASWCWREHAEGVRAADERPSRLGITRGVLELPTCSVSVLITQTEDGGHVASALLWTKAEAEPRAEVFRRATRRATWEALSAWVAEVIS